MKQKYATKEYVQLMILLPVAFSFAIVLFLVGVHIEKDMKYRSLIASPYNFSEEECVERNNTLSPENYCKVDIVTRKLDCRDAVTKQFPGECLKYCHTEKKQVGEKCGNETVVKIKVGKCPDEVWTPGGDFGDCLYADVYYQDCIPIYETKIIEGTCRAGDEVRRARRLVSNPD